MATSIPDNDHIFLNGHHLCFSLFSLKIVTKLEMITKHYFDKSSYL